MSKTDDFLDELAFIVLQHGTLDARGIGEAEYSLVIPDWKKAVMRQAMRLEFKKYIESNMKEMGLMP
jgi:hypothetical protein